MMKVTLFLVPYDSGLRDYRMGRGPAHLASRGLESTLCARGHDLRAEWITLGDVRLTEIAAAFELDRQLSERVGVATRDGRFPVVLSGNCICAVGALAAVGGASCELAWFDAHGDFNTPDTTRSGFLDGMALAVATGACWSALARSIPRFAPLADSQVVHIGGRAFDDDERGRLDASEVTVLDANRIGTDGLDEALASTIEPRRAALSDSYLHIDLDVIDPRDLVANQFATANGLTVDELLRAVELCTQGRRTVGLGISAYDPEYDVEGAGPRVVERLILATLDAAAADQ